MPNKLYGMTLIELVIVLTIISILASLALSGYSSATQKSRRSDGIGLLLDAEQRLSYYHYEQFQYTNDIAKIGYDGSQSSHSEEGFYALSIVTDTSSCPITDCYEITATPVAPNQVSDGALTLSSTGLKSRNGQSGWQ